MPTYVRRRYVCPLPGSVAIRPWPPTGRCPECRQNRTVYDFTLTAVFVRPLVRLGRLGPAGEPVHKNDFCVGLKAHEEKQNFQKMKYTGLVAGYVDEDGVWRKGWYVLTRRGQLFLRGLVAVPEVHHHYLNELIGWSRRKVYIHEVKELNFDAAWDFAE